jgi:hypothetical protein
MTRGIIIQGSGKSPIDLYPRKRNPVRIKVLGNPTGGTRPNKIEFTSLNAVVKEIRKRSQITISRQNTQDFKENGAVTLSNGVEVFRIGKKGVGVKWPTPTGLIPVSFFRKYGDVFRMGGEFIVDNRTALHGILPFWGIEIKYDSLTDHMQHNCGIITFDSCIDARELLYFESGRVSTFGKPNSHQEKIKKMTKLSKSMAALAE